MGGRNSLFATSCFNATEAPCHVLVLPPDDQCHEGFYFNKSEGLVKDGRLSSGGKAPKAIRSSSKWEEAVCLGSKPSLTDTQIYNIQLQKCARLGDFHGVREALSRGAKVNTTALLVIAHGANKSGLDCQGEERRTPLMHACEYGHQEIVKFLVKARASLTVVDENGWSALCHALGEGHVNISNYLIEELLALHNQKKPEQVEEAQVVVSQAQSEILENAPKEKISDIAMLINVFLQKRTFTNKMCSSAELFPL